MQAPSSRRTRRSNTELKRILRKFEQSGLTQAAFCRREKIARGTFLRWKRRLEKEIVTPPEFIEVVPARTSQEFSEFRGEFELSLPGGVVFRWKA